MMKKDLIKPILTMMVIIAFGCVAGIGYAADKKIVVAEQSWAGATAICNIWKHVLESKLGIQVDLKPIAQAMAWPAIEKGTVDVIPDMWLPNQKPAIDKYVHEKKVAELSVTYDKASQGIFVPTWVAEKYNIKKIDDLNEHTKLFDFSGDGKGDLWVGAFAWMVSNEMKIKIRDYGLNYNALNLEQFAFLTILTEKMRKKQPIIFYYWSPEWIFAKYDLTKIEEPPYEPSKWKFVENKPDESYIACDWQPGIAHTAIRAGLKNDNPKAYKFFKNFYIPLDQMNLLIADIVDAPDNPKKDPTEVAKKWVEDNPKIVNDWLK
jgi:glycine betaine/proline transport system substrate-binding protein